MIELSSVSRFYVNEDHAERKCLDAIKNLPAFTGCVAPNPDYIMLPETFYVLRQFERDHNLAGSAYPIIRDPYNIASSSCRLGFDGKNHTAMIKDIFDSPLYWRDTVLAAVKYLPLRKDTLIHEPMPVTWKLIEPSQPQHAWSWVRYWKQEQPERKD